MSRYLILMYGVFNYLLFLGVAGYSALFIGNIWIPNSLDATPTTQLSYALLINLALLSVFAIQHSGMARQGFKNWLTRWVHPAAERSTYVLFSNLAMLIIFLFWQPMGQTIWSVESPFLVGSIYALYFVGWGVLLAATFSICHFDLFGLRQVWLNFQGIPYRTYSFRIPYLYSLVRHPIYVGWLMIIWFTPMMTLSHLVFAVGTTIYIFVGIYLEERDLVRAFGRQYQLYREKVPMLIPIPRRKNYESKMQQVTK